MSLRLKNKNKATLKLTPYKFENNDKIVIDEISMENKLHPTFPSKFLTIFGRVYNVENVLNILNKPTFLSALSKPVRNKLYRKIQETKPIHIPNYWKIMNLVILDRMLSDKKLVNDIVNYVEETSEFDIITVNVVKKGVIETEVVNPKYKPHNLIIKTHMYHIYDFFKDHNVLEMTKEEYKEVKNELKAYVFDKTLEKVEGKLLEGLSDIDNKELKTVYLK